MLTTQDDHWHPASGIDAAADKVEVSIMCTLARGLEREVFAAVAYHPVNRPAVGGVTILYIERGPKIFNDDVLPYICQPHSFQFVETQVF